MRDEDGPGAGWRMSVLSAVVAAGGVVGAVAVGLEISISTGTKSEGVGAGTLVCFLMLAAIGGALYCMNGGGGKPCGSAVAFCLVGLGLVLAPIYVGVSGGAWRDKEFWSDQSTVRGVEAVPGGAIDLDAQQYHFAHARLGVWSAVAPPAVNATFLGELSGTCNDDGTEMQRACATPVLWPAWREGDAVLAYAGCVTGCGAAGFRACATLLAEESGACWDALRAHTGEATLLVTRATEANRLLIKGAASEVEGAPSGVGEQLFLQPISEADLQDKRDTADARVHASTLGVGITWGILLLGAVILDVLHRDRE